MKHGHCECLTDSPAWQLSLALLRQGGSWVLLALRREDSYWFATSLLFLFLTEKRQVSVASVHLCVSEGLIFRACLLCVCSPSAYSRGIVNTHALCARSCFVQNWASAREHNIYLFFTLLTNWMKAGWRNNKCLCVFVHRIWISVSACVQSNLNRVIERSQILVPIHVSALIMVSKWITLGFCLSPQIDWHPLKKWDYAVSKSLRWSKIPHNCYDGWLFVCCVAVLKCCCRIWIYLINGNRNLTQTLR